jgi:hypothetical protein
VRAALTISAAELRRDLTAPDERRARQTTCEACEDSQRHLGHLWCGTPLVETETTCGCDCYLISRYRSKGCPQAKFPTHP